MDTVGQNIVYVDEKGDSTVVDMTGLETLTSLDTVGQTITYRDEDGDLFIADIQNLETLTPMTYNETTGVYEYTDEDGTVTTINFRNEIDSFETITTLKDNNNGTFTYTNENGADSIITKAGLLDNGNDTYTFDNGDGSPVTFDLNADITTIQDTLTSGGNEIATYTNEEGNNFGVYETVTTFDTSGTNLVYTDETGMPNTIDMYSANRIVEIYDVVGGQTLGTAFGNINFATAVIVDPGYTVSGSSITVNTAGRYRVTYRVTTQVTNNTRSGADFQLTNGGVPVAGSYAASYQRNKDVDRNTVAVTKMLNLSAGAILRVEGKRYSNTGNIDTVAHGSSLLVERIR